MRENFLSLNEIRKKSPGFKFYQKDKSCLFELVSVKEETIHVAHGILGDKYQKKITISAIDEHGNRYVENNLTDQLNNGNIYTIAFLEKDWDELKYLTVESVDNENKNAYIEYLKDCQRQGAISELQMYKKISEI